MWEASGFGNSELRSNQTPGGFLDTTNFNSPSKSQDERKRADRVTNIVPCTVAQLLKVSNTEDHLIVGSLSAHIITIVGLVREINVQSTKIGYMIDDMSGLPIEVQLWIGEREETEKSALAVQVCSYVRVTGALRMMHGKQYIIAFKINPIKEINEITMHILEVIHTSMTVAIKDSQLNPVFNPHQIKSETHSGVITNQFTPNNSFGRNSSAFHGIGGVSFDQGTYSISGLTKPQQMVLHSITNCTDEQGAYIGNIFNELKHLNRKTIQDAMEFLSNEGHIYSTIDDNHYKSTDSA